MFDAFSLDLLNIHSTAEMVLRLGLACFFGGVIGYEREYAHRPAGFRTHVLVCVGAALTMMTGEHVVSVFPGASDPARIGAQVVSGIGFLGAGTIMRAGFNVRGLTTAASLWAVSTVGLACGIGCYRGAIASGSIICIVLIVFKRFERRIWQRHTFRTVVLTMREVASTLTNVSALFAELGIEVRSTTFDSQGADMIVRLAVRMPNCSLPEFFDSLTAVDGVAKASIE